MKMEVSQKPSFNETNDPVIIPETDNGKVRNLNAEIQALILMRFIIMQK